MRRAVILGEGQLDGLLVARLHADELLLEARDELLGAEHQVGVARRAALEGLAVDLADEVDGHPVAFLGGPVLGLVGAGALGDALHLFLDLLVGDLDHRPLDLDAGRVLELEARQRLVGEGEAEVRLALQDLLGLALVLGHVDLRLHGGALVALGDDAARRGVEDVLDDLGHQRLAVHLAQVRHRDLARPEALQPHLVFGLVEPGLEARFKIRSGHDDLDLALQPLGLEFRYLHSGYLFDCRGTAAARPEPLMRNPWKRPLVRVEGLEPPCLSALGPKPSASANSATPARSADDGRRERAPLYHRRSGRERA